MAFLMGRRTCHRGRVNAIQYCPLFMSLASTFRVLAAGGICLRPKGALTHTTNIDLACG